jgi:exosortase A-associated hydrolase 2
MLPPIGEEMNKSRRMFSLQAQHLAKHGVISVIPDLYGLGDSEGATLESTFDVWQVDLVRIIDWISSAYEPRCLQLLALRSGALLTDFVFREQLKVARLLLWSPSVKGARTVKELYRQALIFERNRGNEDVTVQGLKDRTSECGLIEIAGYEWSADLLRQLQSAALPESVPDETNVVWFDVRAGFDSDSPPPEPPLAARWRNAGTSVNHQYVSGPPFWQTSEISTITALTEATTAAVLEMEDD